MGRPNRRRVTQRQPVRLKTNNRSRAQKPWHDGASASPQAVVRHSQAPPDATPEQWPPFPHVPTQRPSLNSHERCARVVVVVDAPPVGGVVVVVVDTSDVGTQSSWLRRKLTTR